MPRPKQRRATVADFAQRLFGHPFTADQVIEETLVPFTEGGAPSPDELAAALAAPVPATLEDFRRNAIARWAELEFGIEPEEGGRLKRRVPRTLATAAARLAEASGSGRRRLRGPPPRDADLRRRVVARRRRAGLCLQAAPVRRPGPGVVCHAGTGDRREFSLEGQVQAGGGRIFVPIKFCRQCGQDYYHVLRSTRDSSRIL